MATDELLETIAQQGAHGGSLFGGQSLDPVLEITFPTGERGAVREVRLRLEAAGVAMPRVH